MSKLETFLEKLLSDRTILQIYNSFCVQNAFKINKKQNYIDIIYDVFYNIVHKVNNILRILLTCMERWYLKWMLRNFAGRIVWSARAPVH